MYLVGIEFAGGYKFFNFGNGDNTGCSHHVVEVIGSMAVYQVALCITFPGFYNGKVGTHTIFKNVHFAVELTNFLVALHLCAIACRYKECRNTIASGPDTFCQRSLRDQFNFKLAAQQLTFKFFVFAHIRSYHFLHLVVAEQFAQSHIVNSRIVRNTG